MTDNTGHRLHQLGAETLILYYY